MKLPLLWVFAFLMFSACGQPPDSAHKPPEKRSPLQLTRSERGYEATLQYMEGSHLLTFTISPDKGPGELSIRDRISIWKPLAEQFFREHGRDKQYLVGVGRYPELNSRIAFAAACSDKWDTKLGKPKGGEPAAAYIKSLISEGNLAAEVESFFDSLGYKSTVDYVEGVMLCDWSRMRPDATASCHPDLDPKASLPCGASILFRATAKQ